MITTAGPLDGHVGAHTLAVNVSDGSLTAVGTVTITVTSGNPFDDDDGSIFEEDIEWLAAAGITKAADPVCSARQTT